MLQQASPPDICWVFPGTIWTSCEEGTNAGGFNLCAAADGCTTQLGATADVVPSTLVGDLIRLVYPTWMPNQLFMYSMYIVFAATPFHT